MLSRPNSGAVIRSAEILFRGFWYDEWSGEKCLVFGEKTTRQKRSVYGRKRIELSLVRNTLIQSITPNFRGLQFFPKYQKPFQAILYVLYRAFSWYDTSAVQSQRIAKHSLLASVRWAISIYTCVSRNYSLRQTLNSANGRNTARVHLSARAKRH